MIIIRIFNTIEKRSTVSQEKLRVKKIDESHQIDEGIGPDHFQASSKPRSLKALKHATSLSLFLVVDRKHFRTGLCALLILPNRTLTTTINTRNTVNGIFFLQSRNFMIQQMHFGLKNSRIIDAITFF